MNHLLVRLTIFLTLVTCTTYAQSRSKKKTPQKQEAGSNLPTSLNPNGSASTQNFAPRKGSKSKSSSKKITYDQQQQYYERVVTVAKARQKAEKIMEKPQYSNPMYFGHKKMPKKRPPHKMKLCKECGIRH
jgi:hypothetical protein